MTDEELYDYDPQLASESPSYKEWLISRFEEASELSVKLGKAYTLNRANLDDHLTMISIECELWRHLRPKLKNSQIEEEFELFRPFVEDSRMFLAPGLESYLWKFHDTIVIAFEELGYTSVK